MASAARAKELILALNDSLSEADLEKIKLELLAICETVVFPAEMVAAPHTRLLRRAAVQVCARRRSARLAPTCRGSCDSRAGATARNVSREAGRRTRDPTATAVRKTAGRRERPRSRRRRRGRRPRTPHFRSRRSAAP